MGVYINMEMPKSCRNCPCFCEELFYCRAKEGDDIGLEKRPKDCPLVPVPPHGRLIEAEYLYNAVEQRYRMSSGIEHRCERDLLDVICGAPTIIPPEEGET